MQRRTFLIIVSSTFMLIVLVISAATYLTARPQFPKILASRASLSNVDFGVQSVRDGTAKSTLMLSNPLAIPIRVKKVTTGCGCTVVPMPAESVVPALGRLAFDVLLDRQKMKYGTVRTPIQIEFDDGSRISAISTYNYQPTLDFSPETLLITDSGSEFGFEVTLDHEQKQSGVKVSCGNGAVTIRNVGIKDHPDGRVTHRFVVSATDPVEADVTCDVDVVLSDGTKEVVPLTIASSQEREPTPTEIAFYPINPAEAFVTKRITLPYIPPADVAAVVSSSDMLTATLELAEERGVVVVVTVDVRRLESEYGGYFDGAITLKRPKSTDGETRISVVASFQ